MAFIDQREIKIACSSEMNVPQGRPNIDKIFCLLFYRMKKARAQRLERNKEALQFGTASESSLSDTQGITTSE